MQLDKIKITEITPAKYNPRQIDIDNYSKLIDSLNTFGLIDPIIINLKNDNTIIGGHQRFNIIMSQSDETELNILKLGDIGWVFDQDELRVDDENMEKLMNITLNQNNLMGEWNNSKLETLFTEFELEDIDLAMTGFDDWEIDEIVFNSSSMDNSRLANTNLDDDREELNSPVVDIFDDREPEEKASNEDTTENENHVERNIANPNPKEINADIETFQVIIECSNELEQEQLYEQLTEQGYKCQVLTL